MSIKRGWANRWLLMLPLIALALCLPPQICAQQSTATAATIPSSQTGHAPVLTRRTAAPVQLTLKEAIQRAHALSPALLQAMTNAKVASEQPVQTRALLLPSVSANSQYLYTQGNGTASGRYITNNGVHEYITQADVHQELSLGNFFLYRKSVLAAAMARDQADIADRGLTVAVVAAYATLVAANQKYQANQEAAKTAHDFLQVTQQLETGGQVAHADVIKARIQFGDSQIALRNAAQTCDTARAALALMVFPNVRQSYEVVDDPGQILELPPLDLAEAQARQNNPSLAAAFKNEDAAKKAVDAAVSGYFPTITFDYFYGIDANHFAMTTPSDPRLDPELHGAPIQNLGYSALASITIPVWNWGATHSKVKDARIFLHQADQNRQYAERRTLSDLDTFYGEAQTAKSEMAMRRTQVTDAMESQKLTLLQYKAGQATALQVVSAQTALTTERDALADAQTRYAIALANLSTLTGKLQ